MKIFLSLVLLFFSIAADAQKTNSVSGRVVDSNGSPLTCSITTENAVVPNTMGYTANRPIILVQNVEGDFNLKLALPYKLEISSYGYKTKTITSDKSELGNIVLERDHRISDKKLEQARNKRIQYEEQMKSIAENADKIAEEAIRNSEEAVRKSEEARKHFSKYAHNGSDIITLRIIDKKGNPITNKSNYFTLQTVDSVHINTVVFNYYYKDGIYSFRSPVKVLPFRLIINSGKHRKEIVSYATNIGDVVLDGKSRTVDTVMVENKPVETKIRYKE